MYIAGGRVRVIVTPQNSEHFNSVKYFIGQDDEVFEYGTLNSTHPVIQQVCEVYGTIVCNNIEWNDEYGAPSAFTVAGNRFTPEDIIYESAIEISDVFGFVEGQLEVLITGNVVNGYVKNGRFYACITDYDPEISDNRCLSGIYKHGSVPLASLDSMLTNANDKLYGASLRGSWSPAESALHAALPLEVVGTVIDYGDDGDPGEQLPLLRYSVDL